MRVQLSVGQSRRHVAEMRSKNFAGLLDVIPAMWSYCLRICRMHETKHIMMLDLAL